MGELLLVEEVNGEARVSSKVIAELSGARIDSLHRIIRNHVEDVSYISDVIIQNEHNGGNPKRLYLLSMPQWKYVLSLMKRTTGVEECAKKLNIDLNCVVKRIENQLHSILRSICNGYIGFMVEHQYVVGKYRLDFCVTEKIGSEYFPCFFVEYNEKAPHMLKTEEDINRIAEIRSHIKMPCIVIEEGYEMEGVTAFVAMLNSSEVNSMEATSYSDINKLEGIILYA